MNNWIEHAKKYQKEYNVSYKEALKHASSTYQSTINGEGINTTEQRHINEKIYDITKKEALEDYLKLKNTKLKDININSNTGRKFVDYFTSYERMRTKSRKGITFFEFLDNKNDLKTKQYIKNFFEYYKHLDNLIIWWKLFNLYYGSINQFKPTISMYIYKLFKPTSILDFTMGWGGRLVGACALNIPYYTGIDLNLRLKTPYKQMIETLKPMTTTKINLIFDDALNVDYKKINYDMVLTSPPYYNIELYDGTEKRDNEKWDTEFYEPLFRETFKYLKKGGYYCLNVPESVYNNVCIKILGKADKLIPMHIVNRGKNNKYKEYIYMWKKI